MAKDLPTWSIIIPKHLIILILASLLILTTCKGTNQLKIKDSSPSIPPLDFGQNEKVFANATREHPLKLNKKDLVQCCRELEKWPPWWEPEVFLGRFGCLSTSFWPFFNNWMSRPWSLKIPLSASWGFTSTFKVNGLRCIGQSLVPRIRILFQALRLTVSTLPRWLVRVVSSVSSGWCQVVASFKSNRSPYHLGCPRRLGHSQRLGDW